MAEAGFSLHGSPSDRPDLMNDPAFDVNPRTEEKATAESDTCRICRSEGTPEEPLFHPCKCSGSIKHVHQECLMEWLSHTNKKHCELCKTPFRFTKLYHADTPDALPFGVFLARALLHVARYILTWFRAVLVGLTWLIILPWCVRWAWRGLFFMMDAGWAREPWLAKIVTAQQNGTSLTSDNATMIMDHNQTTSTGNPLVDGAYDLPVMVHLALAVWDLLAGPWKLSKHERSVDSFLEATDKAATSSLLSDLDFAHNLTESTFVNRAVLDIMEGQVITIVVVVVFILVFLIREWVIQQQPILNAAVHVRDRELELERTEQARQRLQDEIRHFERQIEQLNNAHLALNQEIQAQTPPRSETHSAESNSSQPSAHSRATAIDWQSFQQRVTQATETWIAADRHRSPESVSMVQELNEGVASITQRAITGDITDADTFTALVEWVRQIPSEVDAMWLSDQATVFSQLISSLRSESTSGPDALSDVASDSVATEGIETPFESTASEGSSSAVTSSERPVGDSAGGPHQIIAGEEAADQVTAESETIDTSRQGGLDRHEAVERTISSGTSSSWESMESSAERTNIVTGRDDAAAGPSAPDGQIPAEQLKDDHISVDDESPSPAQQSRQSPSPERSLNTQRQGPARQSLLDSLWDFFWGGIDLSESAVREARIHTAVENPDEVQVVEIVEQAEIAAPEPNVDPEVAAAAAEAGLNAEAVEEAEDLEGVMELIGMQGPIIILVQTALFCGLLVSVTLWGAVGAPYLFGKLALQIFGDPILFFVIMPLQTVANAGDLLLDVATILTGGFLSWFLSAVKHLLQAAGSDSLSGSADKLSDASVTAVQRAGEHLLSFFTSDGGAAGTDSYFLLASLQAHHSLVNLKAGIAGMMSAAILWVTDLVRSSPNELPNRIIAILMSVSKFIFEDIRNDFKFYASAISKLKGGNIFALTVREPRPLHIDPVLSYWSGKDRALAIIIGYGFLALIGAAFLLRTEPFFSSPSLQKIEKGLADILKQAGGVIKVILIISIEMLLFPLYCGVLLDVALMPLFQGVTLSSRMEYAIDRPYMFAFLHWFLGTAYMFNFALFVSMCRRILRSGVLYFIRDPDDPTFHPVRDVLERNIATQLRKIAFSALVYGFMVLVCMGGVVWSIANISKDIFPIRWSKPDPVLEFPIEFFCYNFISPFVFKMLQPSAGLESLYDWWLRKCARQLRLSHFLFGERKKDEESVETMQKESSITIPRGGTYVKVPASDQVRVQRGQPVFTPVTEQDVDNDETVQDQENQRKPNKRYRNVYIPSWFRARIGLFLAGLWFLSAGVGASFTIIPLAAGRIICSAALPPDVRINDIWAYSVGIHALLLVFFAVFRAPGLSKKIRHRVDQASHSVIMAKLYRILSCSLRSVYVYGFVVVFIPSVMFVLIQLYITAPLRTYTRSTPSLGLANDTSANPTNLTSLFSPSLTLASNATVDVSSVTPPVGPHVVYALPDYALGFITSRLTADLLRYSQTPLPAAIMHQIVRNGKFNPDATTATRAVVLPILLFSTIAIFAPAAFAGFVTKVVLPVAMTGHGPLDKSTRTKIYRYAYPIVFGHVVAIWTAYGLHKAVGKWKDRIKDEVYLIGERLHNFGERKPPPGSKGVMKKGKDPVVDPVA